MTSSSIPEEDRGQLREGVPQLCSLLALDAVGHSDLVSHLGFAKSNTLFEALEGHVRAVVERNSGRLLGWQGDGGIALFPGTDDQQTAQRGLNAAQQIIGNLPALNEQHELASEDRLQLRIALHSGFVVWRENTGSIHSPHVNFVAHLQGSLPEDMIGLSDEMYNRLNRTQQANCLEVGRFEGHSIFLYDRDRDIRHQGKDRYEQKRLRSTMGSVCEEAGLVFIGYRHPTDSPLPLISLYEQVSEEVLMVGVSLATSLDPRGRNPTLDLLRKQSSEGRSIKFLILDPDQPVAAPFAEGIQNIRRVITWVKEEITRGRFDAARTELRGLDAWPHYTGVMVDGNADGRLDNIEQTIKYPETLIVQLQSTIPPESDASQHYAPTYRYQRRPPNDIIYGYVRGFRYYWQNGKDLL